MLEDICDNDDDSFIFITTVLINESISFIITAITLLNYYLLHALKYITH